jgi:pyruvate formate lyase activating enzyme
MDNNKQQKSLTPPLSGQRGAAGEAYIHSTESFGSVDGPGIRFLIFLQGCHMRCRYCHNPDTWKLGAESGPYQLENVSNLLDKAERYRSYWGPDGGITVSGGEALLQIDFLIELFEEAHRRGINTCLDTAAQPFTRREPFFGKFERLMKSTDLVLLDLKHMDPERHRWLTGHRNDAIIDCARYLSDTGIPVWIRHVLVPGITDDPSHLDQLREFIDTLKNVKKVEVLPYHTLGIFKWQQLGLDYTLTDIPTPTPEQVREAEQRLGL